MQVRVSQQLKTFDYGACTIFDQPKIMKTLPVTGV